MEKDVFKFTKKKNYRFTIVVKRRWGINLNDECINGMVPVTKYYLSGFGHLNLFCENATDIIANIEQYKTANLMEYK